MSVEKEELGVYGRLYLGVAPAKILDFFIEYQDIYSQSEIARHTSLSNKTAFTAIKKLEKLRLLKLGRKIGQAKMYKLNLEESKAAQLLTDASLEIARVENEEIIKEQVM
jgi:DNA-binding MarR family transcriptional regulator